MKKESILKPFLRIGFYYIVYILVIALISIVLEKNKVLDNILMIIADASMIAFTLFIFRNKMKNSLKDFKKNFKSNIKIILKYWAVGLVLMMITNLIINVFLLGGIAPNEETNRSVLNIYPIYAICTMCLTAPITEELLFRLNFKDSLKTKKSFVITTGIIFGALHVVLSVTRLTDLLYLIPYSILGFTFALIFYDTKNITSSILAHIIHNTLTIAIILLGI